MSDENTASEKTPAKKKVSNRAPRKTKPKAEVENKIEMTAAPTAQSYEWSPSAEAAPRRGRKEMPKREAPSGEDVPESYRARPDDVAPSEHREESSEGRSEEPRHEGGENNGGEAPQGGQTEGQPSNGNFDQRGRGQWQDRRGGGRGFQNQRGGRFDR